MIPKSEKPDRQLIAFGKAVSNQPLLSVNPDLKVEQLKTLSIDDLDRISRERTTIQMPAETIFQATLELNRRLKN